MPFLLLSFSQGSFSLIIKFFPPFWESHHQVGGIKHSPPVALTWQLFAYIMEQALVCTSAQPSHSLPGRIHWPQLCTLWSPPCWTPSSTAWGTETSKGPCEDSSTKQSNLHLECGLENVAKLISGSENSIFLMTSFVALRAYLTLLVLYLNIASLDMFLMGLGRSSGIL